MIAYFDTIGGISGDMVLGAFVGAGMPFDILNSELSKLNLPGFELGISHRERSGIVATKIEVIVSEQPGHHRHLKDIHAIIEDSSLSENVKDRAKRIFQEVAKAEAAIHDSTIEQIHFHEVGAVDSIVDIVGAAICMEYFKIDEVYSSPVKVGAGGFVNSAHGKLPIPTPAALHILKDYLIVLTDIQHELTTPTGAAIIKALSKGTIPLAKLKISSIGYGSGTKDFAEIPNLLRIMIGHIEEGYETDSVVLVETNIDDMNPEICPYVIEQLMSAGALDAYVVSAVMKKGRPGVLLSAIAEQGTLDAVLAVLFRETTTLGVRILPVERRKIPRSSRNIQTSLGTARVKVVVHEGQERLIPEFEECKRIAKEKNLPLKDVYRVLEREIGG
jgi:hypothetical protein